MTKAEIRADIELSYKEKYFYECRKSERAGHPGDVYTFGMLQKLRDMARDGVYPDGEFSDQECNVWEMFRNFHIKEDDF